MRDQESDEDMSGRNNCADCGRVYVFCSLEQCKGLLFAVATSC